MNKTLITIAFAVASMPMFAANQAAGQANPPVAGSTAPTTQAKPVVKTKKHSKKVSKKTSVKKDATTAPVAK